MEMTSYDHGVPSWVDIGVADMDKAAAFYGGLLGWELQDPIEGGMGYRLATLRGVPVAGFGPKMNPGPPAWTTCINVDDVDDIAARATAAGGSVLMPVMDVLTSGRLVMVADPSGAVLSAWQPLDHPGAGLVNESGTLCWNELNTRDTDAAVAFYPQVFGWTVHASTEDGPMPYTEWQVDGRSVAGMLPMPEMVPAEVPDHWMVYFAVEDCDASMAKVGELGGSVAMGPMDVLVGRFAVCQDDQGATFCIIALAEEP